jgi:hypothetical protein
MEKSRDFMVWLSRTVPLIFGFTTVQLNVLSLTTMSRDEGKAHIVLYRNSKRKMDDRYEDAI